MFRSVLAKMGFLLLLLLRMLLPEEDGRRLCREALKVGWVVVAEEKTTTSAPFRVFISPRGFAFRQLTAAYYRLLYGSKQSKNIHHAENVCSIIKQVAKEKILPFLD